MKKTVFIHMGLHKTGSSAIQFSLVKFRSKLESSNFNLYRGGFPNGNHYEVSYVTLRQELDWPMKHVFRRSVNEVRSIIKSNIEQFAHVTNENLIISAESLSFIRTQNEINSLCDLFPEHWDLIPIIFLRDKSDWIKSYRKQFLKNADSSITQNPDSYLYLEKDSWVIDHQKLVDLISQNFNNFRVINYNNRSVQAFWEAIGLDHFIPEYRVNVTS